MEWSELFIKIKADDTYEPFQWWEIAVCICKLVSWSTRLVWLRYSTVMQAASA